MEAGRKWFDGSECDILKYQTECSNSAYHRAAPKSCEHWKKEPIFIIIFEHCSPPPRQTSRFVARSKYIWHGSVFTARKELCLWFVHEIYNKVYTFSISVMYLHYTLFGISFANTVFSSLFSALFVALLNLFFFSLCHLYLAVVCRCCCFADCCAKADGVDECFIKLGNDYYHDCYYCVARTSVGCLEIH